MIGEVYDSSASHFDHDEPISRKTASMIALRTPRSYLLEDETPSVAAAVSNDEGEFSVSIDFRTNFSSVAYGL
ncbi:unnamed protein product [Rhizoctonia solani]|uniref:Uncharacterized protein n=1 Tax=Rhizoctonia solani TaxID=456999 RepID=A0A8H3HCI1_9AGAM|nr:unnamed protein product [Rhizoctonia solani]